MKELSIEQIEHNWKKLMQLIEDTFEGDRLRNESTIKFTKNRYEVI